MSLYIVFRVMYRMACFFESYIWNGGTHTIVLRVMYGMAGFRGHCVYGIWYMV